MKTSSRLRLWPMYAILGLVIAALTWIWGVAEMPVGRQYRVIPTMVIAVLGALLLLMWFVVYSGVSRRVRLSALFVVLLVGGLGASVIRVRGLTGDWVPILAFRWERPASPPAVSDVEPAVAEQPAGTAAAEPASAAATAPTAAGGVPAPMAADPHPRRQIGAYPQFLGPSRDSTIHGLHLALNWTTDAPRLLWRQPIGEGWSGFVVVGDLAVTQEQRGDEEKVIAYNLRTGRIRWSHADRTRYETFIAGIGPRATPTIANGRVFTVGATGIFNAFDLASGRRLWSRHVAEENGAELPEWGKATSPLVLGDRVIINAGGKDNRSLVAYDAATGDPVWAAGTGGPSYSSPVLLNLADRPQIVVLNSRSIAGHDPETGALLWEHPWPPGSPNVSAPIALPDSRVLVSTGYGIGSKVYRITADADGTLRAQLEWESTRLKSKFANLLFHDGWIFGLDDGVLTCIDPATGERMWKGGRYGHGQLLLVGDVLLVQTEDGEMVLLEPSAEGPKELTRYAVLDGKTWNPPALAGTYLAVRNEREAAVYELPLRR